MFDPRIQDGEQNHVDKDRRLGQTNYGSCSSSSTWCGGDQQQVVQLRANQDDQQNMGSDDDSGFCSPPLWKNSPQKIPSQPLLSHHVYTSLSPKSRLQAITRGQRELMEMVRDLPESSYELSLKDLVEHHKMEKTQASGLDASNKGSLQQRRGGARVQRQGSKNMVRSGSFEIENKGLFLKMGFPISLQSKKRNKFAGNGTGRVSPKPEGLKGSSAGERDWWKKKFTISLQSKKRNKFAGNGSGRVSPKPEGLKGSSAGERDWWKKKFTGSSDSDSSRTSNNSSGTTRSSSSSGHSYGSNRKKNGRLSSCWPSFQCRSKNVD